METAKESEGVRKLSAGGVLSAIAASLTCVIVLLFMGVDKKPAVIAAAIGAVVGSSVHAAARRKEE